LRKEAKNNNIITYAERNIIAYMALNTQYYYKKYPLRNNITR